MARLLTAFQFPFGFFLAGFALAEQLATIISGMSIRSFRMRAYWHFDSDDRRALMTVFRVSQRTAEWVANELLQLAQLVQRCIRKQRKNNRPATFGQAGSRGRIANHRTRLLQTARPMSAARIAEKKRVPLESRRQQHRARE